MTYTHLLVLLTTSLVLKPTVSSLLTKALQWTAKDSTSLIPKPPTEQVSSIQLT